MALTSETRNARKLKKIQAEELRLRRRSLLFVGLVIPLCLALFGFASRQNTHTLWPNPITERVQRGAILGSDFTVLAEGPAEYRRYPQNTLASHVIGFSGKAQNETDYGYSYGLEGLEFTLDERLQQGEDVVITLDPRIQAIAQKELRESVEKFAAESGSVVILEAGSGRIRAAASYPEYDPNMQHTVTNREVINHKAFLYQFEPGSVMKPFVVAAALETGRWSLDRYIEAPMKLRVGDKTFQDVTKHEEWLTLWDVLRFSSNSGMIHLSERFSDADLYAWIRNFGFGAAFDVPGIYNRGGSLRDYPWVPQDHASITIGQSLSTTSLQLAAAYSIFVNDGMFVTPYLIEGSKVPEPQRRLSASTAETMRAMLRYVVERSSYAEHMAPGIPVAGKTGTADIYDFEAKQYIKGDYNVSFSGFFPADKPKFTMVVTLHKPRKSDSSTVVAAPLFGAIETEIASLYPLTHMRPAYASSE